MKKQNKLTMSKMAAFVGTTALVSLAPQARAQSSDALIDKLVEKGILSVNEAKDLRDEADKDFKTAFQAKTGMPDWVTGYKLSGDVRGRFEQFSGDNNTFLERTRLRYRLRFGVAVNMLDNMEAGFRLGSGDSAGNPLSNNTTMANNFSKKNIWVDTAYGKWTAINSGGWLLAATVGKMDNPFAFTPMVFDPDLTPEGAALTGGYIINDQHSLAFASGAFVLDEEGKFGGVPGSAHANSTHDPFLYGGQVLWNAKWNTKWSSSAGLGAFALVSPEQLSNANVAQNNQGNTRYVYTPSGVGAVSVTGLKYNYTPLIADASVTYTLDSFPLYAGAFPVKFAAEFINNPGAPKDNKAFWIGATFGKSGTKKTWDISYRYEYLEADAWYDQMVDDDNGAFYAANGVNSTASNYASKTAAAGWVAGTNVKGHLIKLNYSFTDSFTFSATCFINDLINLPAQSSPKVDLNSGSIHFYADLLWKF